MGLTTVTSGAVNRERSKTWRTLQVRTGRAGVTPGPPPVRGGGGPTPAVWGPRGGRSLPSSVHGEHPRPHFPVSQAEPHGLFRHAASWEAMVSMIHMSLVTVPRHWRALSVQSKSHFLAAFLPGCSPLSLSSPGREGLLLGSGRAVCLGQDRQPHSRLSESPLGLETMTSRNPLFSFLFSLPVFREMAQNQWAVPQMTAKPLMH